MVQEINMLTAFLDGEPQRYEAGDTVLRFIDRQRGRGFVPTLCDAPHLCPFRANPLRCTPTQPLWSLPRVLG
jgi:hypothetical protein